MRRITLPVQRAASDRRPEMAPAPGVRELAATLADRTPFPVSPLALEPWTALLDRVGAPTPVRANLGRLEAGAFVVATGQQTGLLTGPMLTVLKAARAVSLARALESESGRPVVPVFWAAADDHDLGEIHHTSFLDRRGQLRKVRLELPASRLAAFQVPVPPSAIEMLEELASDGFLEPGLLPPLRPEAGDSLSTWFVRCLMFLFGHQGLVPVEPGCLGGAATDLLQRVLDQADRYDAALRQGASELVSAGLSPPLDVDGQPPIFVIQDDGRHRLRREGDRWTVPGRSLTRAELTAMSHAGLPRWSANVSMRTLLQDHVLPVAAYVAGPAERVYWRQVRALHEAFEVEYPVVVPRPSATVVPARVARQAQRLGGDWTRLLDPAPVPAAAEGPWQARGQALAADLDDFLTGLTAEGPEFATALSRRSDQLRKTLTLVLERAEELHREGSARAAARRSGILEALRPRERPQDRTVNVFSFWPDYGPSLVQQFLDLPLETDEPWLITTEESSDG